MATSRPGCSRERDPFKRPNRDAGKKYGLLEKTDKYLSELERWRLSVPVVLVQNTTTCGSTTNSHSCHCSLLECSSHNVTPRRRLSLIELPLGSGITEHRKLSLVESSTAPPSRSDSSMEIDTSSVSCDWISVPRCDPPCSGSYQPLPTENIENNLHEEMGLINFLISARPVWRAIILGQVMSFLMCSMALCSYYINSVYQVAMPTGQSFMHYGLLCVVYTTWLACRSGERGLLFVLRNRGWRYVLIAVADVEANTLVTTAHQFTTLTSIQLLDCIALPVVLALSCIVLRVRYKMVHIIGIGVCLMGVGCLVWADIEDGRPIIGGKSRLLGDMLCLVAALLFAMIAVAQEFVAKTFDGVEYLGMLGLFGSVLNGLQLAFLEKNVIYEMKWETVPVLTLLCGFGIAQFVFHSIAPVVLRDSGATALQLSLLTSDFYCVLAGILLLQYKVHVLYFVSFSLTMVGVLIYAIKRTPITTQQPASYRIMSRNHTTSFDVELAPAMTLSSGCASVSPSHATLSGSTDTVLSASCISQNMRSSGNNSY